jgi:hypothetical protein
MAPIRFVVQSPSGRRWPEGPDEGSTKLLHPSLAASRHPLPEGEGRANAAGLTVGEPSQQPLWHDNASICLNLHSN